MAVALNMTDVLTRLLVSVCVLASVSGQFYDQLDYRSLLKKERGILSFLEHTLLHLAGKEPEQDYNVSQLISSKGYPVEEYTVQTEDGYLLGVQRIPHGLNINTKAINGSRPTIFLQHGLLCSATNWVANLANESFAFILADAGFDVWLGNVRGNTYSRKHIHLDPNSLEFWEFTWDEMSQYDLPAMLNFALQKSRNDHLYYVGHSQGTMLGFSRFSTDRDLAKKVRKFFALGPVTTVGAITSPLHYLSALPDKWLFDVLGRRDFMPNNEVIKILAGTVCEARLTEALCSNVLFLICGMDKQQLNETRLPIYMSHTPAGTSTQNVIHFAQMVRSKKFCKYDYGSPEENLNHYNQPTPPEYPVENMTTPTSLFWADKDSLADPHDVRMLIPRIQHLEANVEIPEWDHLDFIWGLNARQQVYDKIIKMIISNP